MSILLLSAGVAIYSFMRLNSVEQQQDFDLYTLVPSDAVAVFETDRMMEIIESSEETEYCKDGYFLHLSELSTYLRTFFNAWIENSPHALSRQMNKVLLSFHPSGASLAEVLYCTLGAKDYAQVEAFISRYSSSSFPVKDFGYKGETIRIYSLNDGHFLAVYLTKQFMALSFQKKMLEQVIDARKEKSSLKHNTSFKELYEGKQRNVEAMLYLQMKSVPMGNKTDSLRWSLNLGEWVEFDLKLTDNVIYCSGMSRQNNTSGSLVNAVCQQQNVSMIVETDLPASTVMYQCWAMSDKDALLASFASQQLFPFAQSGDIAERDKEWFTFLKDCAGEHVLSCFFRPDELRQESPCAIVVIPLIDEAKARQHFLAWLQRVPREERPLPRPRFRPGYEYYPISQAYRKYLVPRHSFFAQLTGFPGISYYSYACFYRGRLLLAADAMSLSAYIDALERGDVLQDTSSLGGITHTLAPSCGFLLVADMAHLSEYSDDYKRLMPTFIWQHMEFFSHFFLALQFSCGEGGVYPNITLLYNDRQ